MLRDLCFKPGEQNPAYDQLLILSCLYAAFRFFEELLMAPDPRRRKQLATLLKKLGLTLPAQVNWEKLDLALTHPSYSQSRNYEVLEFLGDAVIRLAASEVLLATYPGADVGEFSALRAMVVSDRTLAQFAQMFGLEKYLLMAPYAAGDRAGRMSRLADAFEALLGALYQSPDSMALIQPWLTDLIKDKAAEIRRDPARQNYKDALQAHTQALFKCLPEYRITEIATGKNADQRFTAQVWLQGEKWGSGQGRSKKAAEQAAAKVAFLTHQPLP